MGAGNITNETLFNDFEIFNNLYINKEKQRKFFLKVKPLLQHDDIEIATKLGDKHLAIMLFLGHEKERYNATIKKRLLQDFLHETYDVDTTTCTDYQVHTTVCNTNTQRTNEHNNAQDETPKRKDHPISPDNNNASKKKDKHTHIEKKSTKTHSATKNTSNMQISTNMEGLTNLSSIDFLSVNSSSQHNNNIIEAELVDITNTFITIEPTYTTVFNSCYMESMWLINQDTIIVDVASNNDKTSTNHVIEVEITNITSKMDSCYLDDLSEPAHKEDKFFKLKHSFISDIIKQNEELVNLSHSQTQVEHTDEDIK
jgi:hypothetical protein